MKGFIGVEKKLEDNTMFYKDPVQIDKDWPYYDQIFLVRVISREATFCSL